MPLPIIETMWTEQEDKKLKELLCLGHSIREISPMIGRTCNSIRCKINSAPEKFDATAEAKQAARWHKFIGEGNSYAGKVSPGAGA
ncbi:MAG: hypothetical protein JKY34_07415 [Kordiimonadaceae bacterium]|nr:hypothetical protein [Kordiimonadaceae bacterium]